MFHNKAPFPGKNMKEVELKLKEKNIKFKSKLNPEVTKWIIKMLQLYPKDRPSIKDVLNDSFFQGYMKKEDMKNGNGQSPKDEKNIFKVNSSSTQSSIHRIESTESTDTNLMKNLSCSSSNSQFSSYPLSKFNSFGKFESLPNSHERPIEEATPTKQHFKKKHNESIYTEIKTNEESKHNNVNNIIKKASNYIIQSDKFTNPSSSSIKVIKTTKNVPIQHNNSQSNSSGNNYPTQSDTIKIKLSNLNNSHNTPSNPLPISQNDGAFKKKFANSVIEHSKNIITNNNNNVDINNLIKTNSLNQSNPVQIREYSKTTNSKLYQKLLKERNRSKSKPKTKNLKDIFKNSTPNKNPSKNTPTVKRPLKFSKRVIKYQNEKSPEKTNITNYNSYASNIPQNKNSEKIGVPTKMKSNSPNRVFKNSNFALDQFKSHIPSSRNNYANDMQPKIIRKVDRKVVQTNNISSPYSSSNRYVRNS